MKQVIFGVAPSKSNCYRIVTMRDRMGHQHSSLAKTQALKLFEKSFYLQCNKYRNASIKGLFEFSIDVYYPSNRSDLDNSLKCILDCLQTINAIKNDNNCVTIVARKFVDKLSPRIEFEIKAVGSMDSV